MSAVSSVKNTHLIRQSTVKKLQEAMTVIIQAVQSESFSKELNLEQRAETSNKPQTVPKLYRLDPFMNNSGVL